MATATAPTADRERLEIIWRTITRDVQRFADENGVSGVNSKRYMKIDRTLEELGGMLVDEVGDRIGPAPDHYSEASELDVAKEDIWKYIETRLLDWAVEVEAKRAARRPMAAA